MYIPDYLEALRTGDEDRMEELRLTIYYQNHNVHPKREGRYDFKFSVYFQPVNMAYTRTLTAGVKLTDTWKQTRDYKRTTAQTVKGTTALQSLAGFYRKKVDTVFTEAIPLRYLFVFIRLLTTGFVRDFIIRRFLKSNEDIVLKSALCREITLESSIH
jgi:hypothetical protein